MKLVALFRLAFAPAPEFQFLNLASYIKSPDHSSIGTPSSVRRRTATFCKLTVSGLFHSPLGVLFTFPSRYWYTIGDQGYLALEGGPPNFPQGFPCPVVLRKNARSLIHFVYGAFTLYDGPSQGPSTRNKICNSFRPNEVVLGISCNPSTT
jgi:hypothetical protein